ncbi:MAG: J domain-containing protein [Acidobacteria bacterium]|nr:J domain-containing protein [Acidobacteriota bacterium]
MDLYVVLDVQREATAGDIKRAYRRLARRWHPDINPGDREAALRFRQVLEAYETLIDPDRRRHYDEGRLPPDRVPDPPSYGFAGFDFSAGVHAEPTTTFGELFAEVFSRRGGPAAAPERGADIHARTTLAFAEMWHGVDRAVTLTRHQACTGCAGSGFRRAAETRCLTCEGTGAVRSVRGHMVFSKHCPRCGGAGLLRQERCERCHGHGAVSRAETLTVRVPAGVQDGARIRVPGKGHAGRRGGAPGDLYLDVGVEPDPRFRRDGDDVHVVLPVAIHEAGLGARIDVETPGGAVRVRVPPGTQSGQRFRLRERGAPTRAGGGGDLVVEVRLALPRVLDERSKELLRAFGRINSESVRD